MKKLGIITYIFLVSSLLILTRCSSDTSNKSEQMNSLLALSYLSYIKIQPINNVYMDSLGTGYEYFHVDIPEQESGLNVSFDYTFDSNSSTKDIYFIFTNISPSRSSTYPLIDPSQSVSQGIVPERVASKPKSLVSANQTMKGKPEISEFNRNPYAYLNKINPVNMLLSIVPSEEPRYDTAGDPTSKTFKLDPYQNVTAHCTNVNTDGIKTLNIWVADDCAGLSYSRPVSELADIFLTSGENNDIFDWVTNIYGAEYGDTDWDKVDADAKDVLITPNNEITILLLDIDNDESAHSGVLGYFWAKDNFKTTAISYSNQRIMIYMDAYLYANHPEEIISALAHELQHMIHFYQKTVIQTNGTGTETWIDEMCSMAAEDLVSDKLGVNGPRGVPFSDGSAGTYPITTGRLPLYIYWNDASVTTWYSGNFVAVSYSVNYALGAYLARNYGGAKFFHNVVHNNKTDYTAIEYALSQNGSSDSFGIILRKWGVANLLSDKTDTLYSYQYNSDNWFPSNTYPVTIEYKTGSINLYNYKYGDQEGPYLYSIENTMPTYSMPPASNVYYLAADNLSGSKTWNIKLKKNVRFTVLVK